MKTMKTFAVIITAFFLTTAISAQTVSLGNKIWWDINDNGKRDSGEPSAGGVTVHLYQDNDDNGVADAGFTSLTSVTDGNGNYSFSGLAAGKYFIRVDAGSSHYVSTVYGGDPDNDINNDNNGHSQDASFYIFSQTITLTPGTEADGTGATNTNINNTCDMGMWKGNGLGDLVWLDDNANGKQDAGESGMAHVTVNLRNAAGDLLETTETDVNGMYYFYEPGYKYGTTIYQLEFITPGYISAPCNIGADDEMDSDVVNGIISSVNVPHGKWNHSFDAGFIPNVLPVKLISFSAVLNNYNKVDLKWSTAMEVNLDYFTVEKSIDGINFTAAGTVFANGNETDRTDYSLFDNVSSIQTGVIYYRLRSVDNDGKSQLSETRIIRMTKTNNNNISIVTYPNPVTNELRITIPANWQNKKAVYEIITLNGQIIKKNETSNSSQTETVNVSNLASGIYFVRVNCEGQTAQQKIVKH
jgi:SdrD B-like domain/Secretion system C-terminal sorting domain